MEEGGPKIFENVEHFFANPHKKFQISNFSSEGRGHSEMFKIDLFFLLTFRNLGKMPFFSHFFPSISLIVLANHTLFSAAQKVQICYSFYYSGLEAELSSSMPLAV